MAKLIKYPMVFVLLLLTASTLLPLCRGGEPAEAIMDEQKKMVAIDGGKRVGMNTGSKVFIPPCIRLPCWADSSASELPSYKCWCCYTPNPKLCFQSKATCWATCPGLPPSPAS